MAEINSKSVPKLSALAWTSSEVRERNSRQARLLRSFTWLEFNNRKTARQFMSD